MVMVLALGFVSSAQFDGFITRDGGDYVSRDGEGLSGTTPRLPHGGVGLDSNDQPAPLGGGLLVLTALGAGYAVSRRKKKE